MPAPARFRRTRAALLALLLAGAALVGCVGRVDEKPNLVVDGRPTILAAPLAREITWTFRVLNNGTGASPNATATLEVALLGGEAGGGTTQVPVIAADARATVSFVTQYAGWGDYTYRLRVSAGSELLLEKRGFYEYCGYPC